MNTSVILSIDTRKAKKDGTFPLILRISHLSKTTSIALGLSIQSKDWDTKKRVIKSTYQGTESVTRLNNFLQKKRTKAIDIITQLDEAGELNSLSVTQIKDKLINADKQKSFIEFGNELVKELVSVNRLGSARSYAHSLAAIKNFTKKKDLRFEELSYDFLNKFEKHHLQKGGSLNGLAAYLRSIRAIYNKAIKSDLVDQKHYPFNKYTIQTKPTKKRAISGDAIKKIKDIQLEESHPCFHARNYFMVSFYLMGISFIDLALLKVSDIKDGRISFKRRKTKQEFNIKVTKDLKEILAYYTFNKSKEDYIFPLVQGVASMSDYKKLDWARKRYNKKLKLIAEICGIEENLTSYVSRHSFASLAKNNDIPVTAISEMLGHTSIKTTQIYLDSLHSDRLDEYNDKIGAII